MADARFILLIVACLLWTGSSASEPADHWSFKPLSRPTPPTGDNAQWSHNPIDAFVAARHSKHGLTPAARAGRRTLIRRVTFNLTGLPPKPEDVAAFVADNAPGAFERVVERLLSSPEYGVRWARHWLDTVRYSDYLNSDPLGRNKNPKYELFEAYRYRDWVVDALNADMPYDQFIVHQIAGDLLPNPNGEPVYPEGLIATTVLAIGFWENGCADKKKVVSDIVDDQIDVIGQAFLALTISCSRCHDHKFDPITQKDYYGLAGIFYSSRILKSVGTKGDHTILLRTPLESTAYRKRRQKAVDALAAVKKEIAQLKSRVSAPAKMVAWFDFEQNTATTTVDNVGSYVGKLHGDAVIGPGKYGQGVSLDGHGDFVDGTSQSAFQVKRGTIMAWFRFDADIRSEGQIAGMPFHTTKWTKPYYALQAWISPDGGHLGAQANHNGARIQTLYPARAKLNVKANEWHHIAAAYDGRFVRLFIDSRPVSVFDAGSTNGSLRYDGSPNLTIGTRNVVDAGNFFKGKIDEVKLFDGALNAVQIRAAMQSPVPKRFADAFRDGTKPPAVDKRQSEIEAKITELEARAGKIRAEMPPKTRLAMAIREGGTPDSLFPGFQDVPVHIRGRYDRLGEVVPRRMPEFLAGKRQRPITKGSGRRELAKWIASPKNPLTARVIVNRVWQHHFGHGLVRTANNFGALGEQPTHPKLLDWLARWFIDHGWSLKKLHRLIVTSATYQQSALQHPKTIHRDQDNRLLTRMPTPRHESESIRDAMLAVAGRLDRVRGGPAAAANTIPRRSLYIQTRRFDRNQFAMLFDCANPEQSVARRSVSTTAPQALFLLNNVFVKQQAAALAERLAKEVTTDGSKRIQRAYMLLFSRPASPKEVEIAKEFINLAPNRRQGWNEYAQLLLMSNEFFYVE